MEELAPLIIFLFIGLASTLSKSKKKAQEASAPKIWPTASAGQPPVTPPVPQATVLPPRPVSAPMTPTVHSHLQPDCDTHDKPGSLGVTSQEGKDPCHERQLTHPRSADQPAQEASPLTFDWTGDAMVKAVVMQEILTRPAVRRQAR